MDHGRRRAADAPLRQRHPLAARHGAPRDGDDAYREWRLLPRTEANLALVRPPRFDPAKYLVVKGNNNVVSDGIKSGKIICKSDRPEFFCDLR